MDSDSRAIEALGDSEVIGALLDIWRGCFEGAELDGDADFFEIGGDSLKAILLIGLCNARFGTTLEAAALFEHPTVTQLSRAIVAASRPPLSRTLVTFREGGAEPSLLLVHPVGGTVFCYADLVPRLTVHRAIYGLQATGLAPGERLAESVEQMAAHYRRAAMSAGAPRPWHLAGWSFGGLVAFELALQLVEAGDAAASLTLIDTPLPGTRLASDEEALVLMASAAALKIDLGSLEASGVRLSLDARLLAAAAAEGGLGPEAAKRTIDMVRNILRLRRDYRAGRLRGDATVIRASRSPIAALEDYDWTVHLSGRVRHFEVAATHESVLRPPEVERVASILEETMAGAESGRATGK